MEEYIVLVNDRDEAVGLEEKLRVHRAGLLQGAFSVFMVNPAHTQMFLQRRASCKYHSPGLWTNACCSHLREGETLNSAIERRMGEELGIRCRCEHLYDFRYRAEFDNGLTENEYDHIYLAEFEGAVEPNPQEIDAYRWMDLDVLDEWMRQSPEAFTVWFRIAYPRVRKMLGGRTE